MKIEIKGNLVKPFIITVIVILLAILTILGIAYANLNTNYLDNEDNILFIASEGPGCFSPSKEYIIYKNGVISYTYSDDTTNKKISKEELNHLLKLSNSINNDSETRYRNSSAYGPGTITCSIYNSKLSSNVILFFDDYSSTTTKNTTDIGSEILKFTNDLYVKYIDEDSSGFSSYSFDMSIFYK